MNAPRDAVVTAPPATAGAAPPTAKAGEKKPGKDPKKQAYEDLFWALLNCSEFVFNH